MPFVNYPVETVQVLLSTYNGVKFLRPLLDTVVNQDWPSVDVLVRDDGSTDGTREVCARGDLPGSRQIGLYGRPVAPRVLIAVGVPGDFEQLTGIVKSAVIVSVGGGAGMGQAADVVFRGDPGDVVGALAQEH